MLLLTIVSFIQKSSIAIAKTLSLYLINGLIFIKSQCTCHALVVNLIQTGLSKKNTALFEDEQITSTTLEFTVINKAFVWRVPVQFSGYYMYLLKDIRTTSTAWVILRWTPTITRKRDNPTGNR